MQTGIEVLGVTPGYVFFFISRLLYFCINDSNPRPILCFIMLFVYLYRKLSRVLSNLTPVPKSRPILFRIVLFFMLLYKNLKSSIKPDPWPEKPDPFHVSFYGAVCCYTNIPRIIFPPTHDPKPRPILWFVCP